MQHSHAIGGKEGLKQMRYLDHWSKKNESCRCSNGQLCGCGDNYLLLV